MPPIPLTALPSGTHDAFPGDQSTKSDDPNNPNLQPAFTEMCGLDLKFEDDEAMLQSVAYQHLVE